MKTITINIPDDCEIKIIKKEEKKEPVIKTYQDIIDNHMDIKSCWLNAVGKIECLPIRHAISNDKNIAFSYEVAKSMQAMAMISQLMPFYGKAITNEEWKNGKICKYCLDRYNNQIEKDKVYWSYYFLAFHTSDQRDDFLKYNEQLVKDYLMID